MGEKQFVVVDDQEHKRYDGLGQGGIVFGPEGRRFAYAAQTGEKEFVVVDGQEGGRYDDILLMSEGSSSIFDSPDDLHYVAKSGGAVVWRFSLVEEHFA